MSDITQVLDEIAARYGEWYGGVDYVGPPARWDGIDEGETRDHYIVRNDVPAMLEALRAVLDVAAGHETRAEQCERLVFDPTQSGMATAHRLAARGIRTAVTSALTEADR